MIAMCPRGDLNPEAGEISLTTDLNSKTGENPRIGEFMRLSLHPPAAVVTDPGTGNRSAAPSRTSGRRATSSDHHPDSGDAISASLGPAPVTSAFVNLSAQNEPIWGYGAGSAAETSAEKWLRPSSLQVIGVLSTPGISPMRGASIVGGPPEPRPIGGELPTGCLTLSRSRSACHLVSSPAPQGC